MGNIILGGGIGILVDAASGAAQQYPDQIIVWMEPEEWSSEADRLEWLQEKRAFEEKMLTKQKAQKKSASEE